MRLRNIIPDTLDYFRLAAATIRRELIDLSRRHFGPHGIGANHAKSWMQGHFVDVTGRCSSW